MPTNADYTQEYFSLLDQFDGDIEGRKQARAYMEKSTAIVHHEVVASSFTPRLYNKETYETFNHIATTTHRILCKVIQHYLDDPAYRDIFSFDKRLEELILLPRNYDALLPFARVDVFLDEDTYEAKFCEFNGDGSSGMNENREITNSITSSQTFQAFAEKHTVESCELFKSWVAEFLAIYDTYRYKIAKPHIAICDFLENAVVDEFKVFTELFKEQGVDCSIYDVRELTFTGEELQGSDGKRVDAIWRRSVTNDIIDHWDDSQNLIAAVKAEKVALIGSFAGHLVHDKQIFQALFHDKTLAFLDADEITFIEKTVPLTNFLTSDDVNIPLIKANKDQWIIKPTDNYGAKDVYAGRFYDQEKWEQLIDTYADGADGEPFLLQEYCTPYKTRILPPDMNIAQDSAQDISSQGEMYNNLQGLYLYNGTFTGVFSRMGPLPTISKDMQGITAATLWVDR